MLTLETQYNPLLVILSVIVAIFASYVALDLVSSVMQAKGRFQAIWLFCGSLAMGFGIWSMHFVGMLAFNLPGVPMAYDTSLIILSILIAVVASALALFVLSRQVVSAWSVIAGGVAMATAIAGMHYTGIYSMRMPASIHWNYFLVSLSVLIALIASYGAFLISIALRKKAHQKKQFLASILMGIAIAGMHYTGMAAATFIYKDGVFSEEANLLATSGLAIAVIGVTGLILGLALASSVIDRALFTRAKKVEETTRLYRNAEIALSELREERELRNHFVSALAHDLRTPLTSAKVSMQLTMRQSTNPELVAKYSLKANEGLQRMDQMIQDLLDAHRISAGQALPLLIELCNLEELLKNTLEDLTTVHGEKFIMQCKEEITGYWDCNYLRRAIENLCTNAIKYGKEGSSITVKAEKLDQKLTLSVHNLGEALSEEDQHSLFVLFHRGRTAQSTGKRGWGLGLTIVKGIAQAHRGKVKVESKHEIGTTFSIEIPMDVRSA